MTQPIFHLANPADAQRFSETGTYAAASLDTEGFIHCCSAEQLAGVIQRYYADADELVVLGIDASELTANLIYENTVGGEELFPHVYGEINRQAVHAKERMSKVRIKQIVAEGVYSPLWSTAD